MMSQSFSAIPANPSGPVIPNNMSSLPNYNIAAYQQSHHHDRDAQIEAHLPQVKFMALRLAAKLPPWVELNDLIGAGVLGLLDAVDKYDSGKGVMFKTYAEMRVRGAILDSLREVDWAPRSMRRRAREVEAAYSHVESTRGNASEEDVAAELKLSLTEFQHLLQDLRGLTITGLDDVDDESAAQAHQLPAGLAPTPLAMYQNAETRRHLTEAIDRLSERERQVVAFYYVEELTMKEIGAILGVTESRVSQVHTQAVVRLRAALGAKRLTLAFAS
jgi:RNA polymerase sigma factor for flagellar operon FliA